MGSRLTSVQALRPGVVSIGFPCCLWHGGGSARAPLPSAIAGYQTDKKIGHGPGNVGIGFPCYCIFETVAALLGSNFLLQLQGITYLIDKENRAWDTGTSRYWLSTLFLVWWKLSQALISLRFTCQGCKCVILPMDIVQEPVQDRQTAFYKTQFFFIYSHSPNVHKLGIR